MKKALAIILIFTLCLPLFACGSSDIKLDDPQWQYEKLLEYITNKQYPEAVKFYRANLSLRDYKDAAKYYEFSQLMDTDYSKGRLGYTYRELSDMYDLPAVAQVLREIEGKISFLDGEWKQESDNGLCRYLAFKDGYAVQQLVESSLGDSGFQYKDKDFIFEIVEHTHEDGTVVLAIGSDTAIYHLKETNQITLVKLAGSSYDTFDGQYTKIA